jgi:probable F420-dependent oxidoreductase
MTSTTTKPRLALTLPLGGAESAVELARYAQERGHKELWLAEVAGGDAYTIAGALAVGAPGMRIGTAVVPAQTRTPMVHAMAALSLSQLTSGKFVLGLGLSSPNIVRDWGGQPYDQPLTRLREHVQVLKRALAGERVDFEGKTLQVKRFKLGGQVTGTVPIYLGALNEKALRLAGELCDGVILNMVPESALPQILGAVRAGAEAVGRDPKQIEVVSRLHVVMTDNPEQGRELVRNVFGAYAATPGYNRCFEWIGFEREARAIREAYAKGDRAGVAAAVSEGLCDAMAVVGTPETVRARVRAYAEQGIDVCVINPIADPKGVRKTLDELAGSLDGLEFEAMGVARATSAR